MRATHWSLRYSIAVAAVGAALVIRHWLHPLVGSAVPFSTIYGALALATYHGGLGPAPRWTPHAIT